MTALILFALAQAPTDVPVAIVVSSRRDADKQAIAVADQLKVALSGQGISAMSDTEAVERLKKLGGVDPRACDGARLCLQKLAQLLQGVVVSVDVSKAGRLTAGHLEAVSFDRVDSLAADDFTSDAKAWNQKSGAASTSFAQKLKAPLGELNDARRARTPPKVAENELKSTPPLDAPRDTKITPEPPPMPPPSVEAEKSNMGPVAYVTTAAAILSAGAGVLCMVLGFLDRGTYYQAQSQPDRDGLASSFNDSQLQGLASTSNLRIGLGGGLLALGVALGITAGILFMKE